MINDGQYESPQYSQTAVYRVADGTKAYILSESMANQAFRFSPDGKLLAYCINGVLSIYQVSDWSEVDNIPLKHTCESSRLNFDSTSQYVITSSYTNPLAIMIYRLSDKTKSRITTTPDQIGLMDLTPDGDYLLSYTWAPYGASNRVTLWNVLRQKMLASQKRWDNNWKYRFSSDGMVVSFPGETADTVQLLNSQDGSILATLHGKWPLFLPDDESVITWNGSGFSRWEVKSGNLLGTYPIEGFKLSPGSVNGIEFSLDGRLFVISDGLVTVFQLDTLEPILAYAGSGVAFSRNGKVFAISNGLSIKVMNIEDESVIGEITLKGYSYDIALSPNGDILATGEYIAKMSVWQTDIGEQLVSYKSLIGGLVFSADGSFFAGTVANGSAKLIIWKTPGKQILHTEAGTGEFLYSTPVELSPDSKTIAFCLGKYLTMMQVGTWEKLDQIAAQTGCDRGSLKFSRDGKMIASAFQGGRVDLWDVSSSALLTSIMDNDTPFQYQSNVQIAFSPDGRYLVTSSGGTIRIWGISPYPTH